MNKWMQLGTPESSDWGKGFRIIIFWMIHLWVLLDSKQQMLVALSMAKMDQKPCSVGRSSGELGCGQPPSHRRRGGREVVTCDVLHHMFQNNVTWRTFHDDPLRIESWNNEVGRTPQMTECWVLWLFYKSLLFCFINPSGILTGFILTAFILASAENGWERTRLHSAMLGRKARDWGTCVEKKTVGGFASLGEAALSTASSCSNGL